MKITYCTSLVGFLVALSALGTSAVAATSSPAVVETSIEEKSSPSASIEDRLNRLSTAFQNRADQLPIEESVDTDQPLAQRRRRRGAFLNGRDGGWADGRNGGWLNGRRGGGWADGRRGEWLNGRRGGWADGRGGSFLNSNPWSNGWSDGGIPHDWRR